MARRVRRELASARRRGRGRDTCLEKRVSSGLSGLQASTATHIAREYYDERRGWGENVPLFEPRALDSLTTNLPIPTPCASTSSATSRASSSEHLSRSKSRSTESLELSASRLFSSSSAAVRARVRETGAAEELKRMQDAVEVTTQHLNQFYSVAGMVISPTHPYLRHWDLILGVCLLYVVHVTPFQVAFLAGTPSDDLPLSPFNPVVWWADRITDGVFAVDIVLNFFLAYRGNLDEKKGEWIRDHRMIVMHYLRGSFALDFISTFPFDLLDPRSGARAATTTDPPIRPRARSRTSRDRRARRRAAAAATTRRTTAPCSHAPARARRFISARPARARAQAAQDPPPLAARSPNATAAPAAGSGGGDKTDDGSVLALIAGSAPGRLLKVIQFASCARRLLSRWEDRLGGSYTMTTH